MADGPPLSPGKVRRLATTATRDGVFCVLAIDHRDSLRVVLSPDDPGAVASADLTALKLELLDGLGDAPSAVMLDPEYSAAQAVVSRTLPGSVAFLVSAEAQGYLGDPTVRRTTLLPGWSVEKAARLGASGVKLLVLYRPDGGAVSEAQEETVREVVADCARHDMPLFLEPLLYEREGIVDDRRTLVVQTAKRLGALGPDVLKLQFPLDAAADADQAAWREACAELDAASPVPWALLSGGGDYERFRDQLVVACEAGASGFMVGRALWGAYATSAPADRPALMASSVRPRFAELCDIARAGGRDWASCYAPTPADERWYLGY